LRDIFFCQNGIKRSSVILQRYTYIRDIRGKIQFPDIAIGALMMKLLIRCDTIRRDGNRFGDKILRLFKRYYERLSAKFIDFSTNNIAYAT